MKFRGLLPALAWAALQAQSSAAWAASTGEQWKAVSTTAMSITGDVTLAPDRIAFGNGKARSLAPAGIVPDFEVYGKKVSATLYKVTAPDDPALLQGTRLCGGHGPQPVTFIAVWKPALTGSDVDPRGMAVFSGSARPAVAGGPNFCGTYGYEGGGTQSATAGGPVHCPQTFQGKSFVQVTVCDGPPSRQMSMKPLQDAAASDSRATKPVAGSDRWTLAPRTDNDGDLCERRGGGGAEHRSPDVVSASRTKRERVSGRFYTVRVDHINVPGIVLVESIYRSVICSAFPHLAKGFAHG